MPLSTAPTHTDSNRSQFRIGAADTQKGRLPIGNQTLANLLIVVEPRL